MGDALSLGVLSEHAGEIDTVPELCEHAGRVRGIAAACNALRRRAQLLVFLRVALDDIDDVQGGDADRQYMAHRLRVWLIPASYPTIRLGLGSDTI